MTSVDEAVGALGGAFSGITFNVSLLGILRVLLTVLICIVAVHVVVRVLERLISKSKLEQTLSRFIGSALKVVIYFVAVLVVLSTLGVDVTSLVALLSVAGLAVSLALQSTLTNLAGGIQLLVTRPFEAGNWVEIGANSGVVHAIGLTYTVLITADNRVVHVPNSDIASTRIINYNGRDTRRIELKVTASYDAPTELVKSTVQALIAADNRIHTDPAPFVRVSDYGSSSIQYTIRVWCDAAEYWNIYFDLMDGLKPAFDKAGIEMTYDHINVHMMNK